MWPMYKNKNTGTENGMRGTRGTLNIPGNVARHSGECRQTFQGMSPNIPGNVRKHSGGMSPTIPGNILQTFFML